MEPKNYTCTFTVKATPQEVYDAITRVREWWTENTDGSTKAVGDVFTVTFGDIHKTTQRITSAEPGKRIVWHVTECYLNFVKDTEEWKGTDIVFDISTTAKGTLLTMTHVGLGELECIDGCTQGWNYYAGESLKKFITTGKGQPDARVSAQDFTTTFVVEQSAKQAYDAIRNMRGWWSEEIEGGTTELNDEFNFHYKEKHRSAMRLVELVPEKKVVWLVTDNYFSFTTDKTEWKGTRLTFEITPVKGRTQVRFTHQGLVPEYECFDICSNAWTDHVHNSLKALIATGKGKPNKKDN